MQDKRTSAASEKLTILGSSTDITYGDHLYIRTGELSPPPLWNPRGWMRRIQRRLRPPRGHIRKVVAHSHEGATDTVIRMSDIYLSDPEEQFDA